MAEYHIESTITNNNQCHTEGQVPQEVGNCGTHSVVETEVIDEIETKTTAHVIDLQCLHITSVISKMHIYSWVSSSTGNNSEYCSKNHLSYA